MADPIRPHLFERHRIIGSPRCAICSNLRSHIAHTSYTTINKNAVSTLKVDGVELSVDQIEVIKGVAFIMLCEMVAQSQPPANHKTPDEIIRVWLGQAINALKREGAL